MTKLNNHLSKLKMFYHYLFVISILFNSGSSSSSSPVTLASTTVDTGTSRPNSKRPIITNRKNSFFQRRKKISENENESESEFITEQEEEETEIENKNKSEDGKTSTRARATVSTTKNNNNNSTNEEDNQEILIKQNDADNDSKEEIQSQENTPKRRNRYKTQKGSIFGFPLFLITKENENISNEIMTSSESSMKEEDTQPKVDDTDINTQSSNLEKEEVGKGDPTEIIDTTSTSNSSMDSYTSSSNQKEDEEEEQVDNTKDNNETDTVISSLVNENPNKYGKDIQNQQQIKQEKKQKGSLLKFLPLFRKKSSETTIAQAPVENNDDEQSKDDVEEIEIGNNDIVDNNDIIPQPSNLVINEKKEQDEDTDSVDNNSPSDDVIGTEKEEGIDDSAQDIDKALMSYSSMLNETQQINSNATESVPSSQQASPPVNTTTSSTEPSLKPKESFPSMLPQNHGSPFPSSSSLILIPPPLPRSGRSGMSNGPMPMPLSPTEATVTNLISSLLPLIVRLLLLSLLSSSSIFGHGDTYIYSPEPSQHFMFERLNDRYQKDNLAMKKALEYIPENRSKHSWKNLMNKRRNEMKKQLAIEKKEKNKDVKQNDKAVKNQIYSRTVIVLNVETFENDMDVTVENLRDSVSCILRQYYNNNRLDLGTELEVVFCIESPGGVVQDFGLAADQLTRLKDAGLERGDLIVTVCVDKIAASGGYMMACQASPGQLFAAPFAILGSIGVLRETINIHDVLEKYGKKTFLMMPIGSVAMSILNWIYSYREIFFIPFFIGVRPLMMKAGSAKAPLTSTTKVTPESLELVQNNLDRVHDAFREMVSKARSGALDETCYEKVTNGDVFLGKHAVEYGLVDRIMTSDEYIYERIHAGDRVIRMHKYDKSRMGMRFSPLDLLLLKSNGILGKRIGRMLVQTATTILPIAIQCINTFGIVKAIDTIASSGRRHRYGLRDI